MLNGLATMPVALEETPREWIQEASEFALGTQVTENDRLTPQWLADKVASFAGGVIGLDPCSNAGSFLISNERWTEGALQKSWRGNGLVYANPPYHKEGESLKDWLAYAASQFNSDARKGSKDELIFLMPSRTEAVYFKKFGIDACSAVMFFTSRLAHPLPGGIKAKGGGRFGSVLLYFGYREDAFLDAFSEDGWGFGLGRK